MKKSSWYLCVLSLTVVTGFLIYICLKTDGNSAHATPLPKTEQEIQLQKTFAPAKRLLEEKQMPFNEFGNQFRYKAKVRDAQDAQLGRWAWDVFLMRQ
jgi:hypothetical protein